MTELVKTRINFTSLTFNSYVDQEKPSQRRYTAILEFVCVCTCVRACAFYTVSHNNCQKTRSCKGDPFCLSETLFNFSHPCTLFAFVDKIRTLFFSRGV